MPRIEWRRRQRRLPTEYVEIPPEVAPKPLDLEIPAFGPDRSFELPQPAFPEGGLAKALAPSSRPKVRYRLPQPPPMPSTLSEDTTRSVDPVVPTKTRTRPSPPETRRRERVMLGESMGDVTDSDTDVIGLVPEPDVPLQH